MSSRREHWETVYRERDPLEVSWHQEDPARSLGLIRSAVPDRAAHIVDVGGGASRLVDHLLDDGYTDVSVLDISATALEHSRARLAERADRVEWIIADVLELRLERPAAVWHDRAVFHFLTDPDERARYVGVATGSLQPDGHLIIAAFGPDGPERCSGLPVQRYSAESMAETLGDRFEPIGFEHEGHRTPSGAVQHFLYGHFRFL